MGSFGDDGVITGTCGGVTLPHTEKTLPDLTLDAGHFSARVTSPW